MTLLYFHVFSSLVLFVSSTGSNYPPGVPPVKVGVFKVPSKMVLSISDVVEAAV